MDEHSEQWLSRNPEIKQLRDVVNCLCRYENYSGQNEREFVVKSQKYFMKVLEKRKRDLMMRMNEGENKLFYLIGALHGKPAFQKDVESECAVCGARGVYTFYTNLFGRSCEKCGAEGTVFPAVFFGRE